MIKLDEKLVGPNTENESEFFKGLEEIGDKIRGNTDKYIYKLTTI